MSVNAPGVEPPELSFTDRVSRGAIWAGGSTLFLRFANIAIMAVVARIVAPNELGIFALTLVVHGVVVSLAELGVSSSIARSDLQTDRIAPTVATISIVSSLFLASVLAIFAEPIAIALGSAEATGPIRIMSLCVAMIGPFAVPGAQLQREFRQDLVFRANAISFVPSSIVLVVVALLGDGATAFAWSRVVGQLIMGTLMTLSVTKRYRPGLKWELVGPLIRFGLPLAFANLMSQILLNVDYVFVGRFLNIADVGFYNLAFNVSVWSTAVIGSMLNGIVLPAFSKVRADGGDLPNALRGAVRSVSLIAFPIAAVTLALASPLIVTIYGKKWESAAPVLGVLALYGAISVICLLLSNVIVSTGRTGVLFGVQVIALVCLVPVMWIGVTVGGLVGVGVAHIVVILIATFPLYLLAIRRSVGTGPMLIFRAMAWPVVASALSGLAGWALSLALPNAPLKLLVGGALAGLVYLFLTAPLLRSLVPASIVKLRAVRSVLEFASRPGDRLIQHRSTRGQQ
ncbi:MOP flippase family protein [soil metagenome]